jgi:hypothetical protein
MNIPGFTSEAAIYKTARPYLMAHSAATLITGSSVTIALLCVPGLFGDLDCGEGGGGGWNDDGGGGPPIGFGGIGNLACIKAKNRCYRTCTLSNCNHCDAIC